MKFIVAHLCCTSSIVVIRYKKLPFQLVLMEIYKEYFILLMAHPATICDSNYIRLGSSYNASQKGMRLQVTLQGHSVRRLVNLK
jgi:hypothetical protein